MKIADTKFDVNQSVFALKNDEIINTKIQVVQVVVDSSGTQTNTYIVAEGWSIPENHVAKDKPGLLAKL
jgi:hypothetical protein